MALECAYISVREMLLYTACTDRVVASCDTLVHLRRLPKSCDACTKNFGQGADSIDVATHEFYNTLQAYL